MNMKKNKEIWKIPAFITINANKLVNYIMVAARSSEGGGCQSGPVR